MSVSEFRINQPQRRMHGGQAISRSGPATIASPIGKGPGCKSHSHSLLTGLAGSSSPRLDLSAPFCLTRLDVRRRTRNGEHWPEAIEISSLLVGLMILVTALDWFLPIDLRVFGIVP